MPYDVGGKRFFDVSTSVEMPATSEAKRKVWNRFSPKLLERAWPSEHLDLGLLASRTIRE